MFRQQAAGTDRPGNTGKDQTSAPGSPRAAGGPRLSGKGDRQPPLLVLPLELFARFAKALQSHIHFEKRDANWIEPASEKNLNRTIGGVSATAGTLCPAN